MLVVFFLMPISSMSNVDFKKQPCRPVELKGSRAIPLGRRATWGLTPLLGECEEGVVRLVNVTLSTGLGLVRGGSRGHSATTCIQHSTDTVKLSAKTVALRVKDSSQRLS